MFSSKLCFSFAFQSSTDAGSTFALEPGDLLMDFTEATPMVNNFSLQPEKYKSFQ